MGTVRDWEHGRNAMREFGEGRDQSSVVAGGGVGHRFAAIAEAEWEEVRKKPVSLGVHTPEILQDKPLVLLHVPVEQCADYFSRVSASQTETCSLEPTDAADGSRIELSIKKDELFGVEEHSPGQLE
ncbi:unnamed protein product [Caretta caretta]